MAPAFSMAFHENTFKAYNRGALVAWLLLAVAPRWKHTNKVVKVSSLFSAAVYLFNIGTTLSLPLPEGGGFNSLSQVKALFNGAHAHLAQACWVHYLCFDLLVGQKVCQAVNFLCSLARYGGCRVQLCMMCA
jgi:hypothetical protein